MARLIIKQPNGLYAVYSSVTDTIVMWNCTVDDLIADAVERETERVRQAILSTVRELDEGTGSSYDLTWAQAVQLTKESGSIRKADFARIVADANAPVDTET